LSTIISIIVVSCCTCPLLSLPP